MWFEGFSGIYKVYIDIYERFIGFVGCSLKLHQQGPEAI